MNQSFCNHGQDKLPWTLVFRRGGLLFRYQYTSKGGNAWLMGCREHKYIEEMAMVEDVELVVLFFGLTTDLPAKYSHLPTKEFEAR